MNAYQMKLSPRLGKSNCLLPGVIFCLLDLQFHWNFFCRSCVPVGIEPSHCLLPNFGLIWAVMLHVALFTTLEAPPFCPLSINVHWCTLSAIYHPSACLPFWCSCVCLTTLLGCGHLLSLSLDVTSSPSSQVLRLLESVVIVHLKKMVLPLMISGGDGAICCEYCVLASFAICEYIICLLPSTPALKASDSNFWKNRSLSVKFICWSFSHWAYLIWVSVSF